MQNHSKKLSDSLLVSKKFVKSNKFNLTLSSFSLLWKPGIGDFALTKLNHFLMKVYSWKGEKVIKSLH